MTIPEIHEIFDLAKYPKSQHEIFDKFVEIHPSLFGYDMAPTECSHCGFVELTIYPIPTRFPVVCSQCGGKSYKIEEDKNV
jgi:hypothetical protein